MYVSLSVFIDVRHNVSTQFALAHRADGWVGHANAVRSATIPAPSVSYLVNPSRLTMPMNARFSLSV
jgi:hypothetical protein